MTLDNALIPSTHPQFESLEARLLLASAFSISDVTQAEGSAGTTNFVFTVTLTPDATTPVSVNYITTDGTATVADSDYVAQSGTLDFALGETTKQIIVQVKAGHVTPAHVRDLRGVVERLIMPLCPRPALARDIAIRQELVSWVIGHAHRDAEAAELVRYLNCESSADPVCYPPNFAQKLGVRFGRDQG
jgi:hypothetical protein